MSLLATTTWRECFERLQAKQPASSLRVLTCTCDLHQSCKVLSAAVLWVAVPTVSTSSSNSMGWCSGTASSCCYSLLRYLRCFHCHRLLLLSVAIPDISSSCIFQQSSSAFKQLHTTIYTVSGCFLQWHLSWESTSAKAGNIVR